MIILFVDDENGFGGMNPRCDLVEVTKRITKKEMEKAELKQIGVMRRGGNWKEILSTLENTFIVIKSGRYNELKDEKHDLKYYVISGNY